MKFKSTIKKLIVPKFEPLGYDFSAPGGVDYFLSNDAEKRILSFDTNRFFKDLLRIQFRERFDPNYEDIFFDFMYLRPEFFPYKLDYSSQEAFDESFESTTQGTVLCVALSVTDSAGRDNKLHLQHALAPAQSLLVQINSINKAINQFSNTENRPLCFDLSAEELKALLQRIYAMEEN